MTGTQPQDRRAKRQRVARKPAAAAERMLERVALGCRAERSVAGALERLLRARPYFHLLHSVPLDRGDIDHIVVGPTGVFVIETKGYRGLVRVTDAGLTVNGLCPDRDPLRQTRRGAAYVRSRLRRNGLVIPWVQAVLCLPYAELERPQCVGGILVTRREHLGYFIRHWHGRPLRDADASRVFALLQHCAEASAA